MSNLSLKENPTLADLQAYVVAAMKERGHSDALADAPKRFMLLLEEAGEFARAARKVVGMKFADDTHSSELGDEAADLLIVLLGLCNMFDIDLEQAFRNKEEKNKQRIWK